MQNHPGTFRAFFATFAVAAFLALTLSSCAVTVALPNGSASSPSLPSKPELPASTERPSTSDSASSSEASSSSTSSSSDSPTTSSSSSEVSSSSSSESTEPAPSPAKWSDNGTTLIGYVFPEDFNGTLILPTDRSYTIATNAFSKDNKQKIRKLVVPSNVVEIKMSAFKACPHLTEVVFEGASIKLGKAVFQDCNNLLSVTLPQQLQDIPEYLFSGCTQLNTINLSKNLQTIGMSAFEKCFALRSITFPETLKVIGSYAFQNAGLTSVDFPKHISKIGEEAFLQNQDLQSIEFAVETGSVELGTRIFANCTSLKTVVLRGKITSLPSGIFSNTSIETLYIPAAVIDISSTALDYDTPPKTIYFAGTKSDWDVISKELYWSEDSTVIVDYEKLPPSSDTLSLLSSLFSIFL